MLIETNFNLFFNLSHIIAVKLELNNIFTFLVKTAYNSAWQLASVNLHSLRQFSDKLIVSRLKENYAGFTMEMNNVYMSGCLKTNRKNDSTDIKLQVCPSFSVITNCGDLGLVFVSIY